MVAEEQTQQPVRKRICPLCGGTSAVTRLVVMKAAADTCYQMVECTRCALRYTQPLPTVDELNELYGQEYYGDSTPSLLSWDQLRLFLHRIVMWQRRRALLDRQPGRLLDIGCGDGDFAAQLKHHGWEVHGTEFSSAASTLARTKGINVHQGDLASAQFPDEFFDVVTLWHVLEHVPDPLVELTEIRRILRADGLLVIEVPNSASLTFRLCGEDWFPLGMPGHLQHFTAATLTKIGRVAGFTVVRRQDIHLLDSILTLISFMNRLGVLGGSNSNHYFVGDYRRASVLGKLLYLILGFVVGLLSTPYFLLVPLLSGNSETVTITARKTDGQ